LEEVTADLSPTIQHGSLVQAQLGAQALEDLEHTQAAQEARAARQRGGRHTLQGRGHGGMLYAEEARDMVTDREQAEVNNAAAALKRAQKAADKLVKAPWLAVFKDVKVKLKELRSMRTQKTKLRKALCVEIRKVTGVAVAGWDRK